jgi:hypothetical protein
MHESQTCNNEDSCYNILDMQNIPCTTITTNMHIIDTYLKVNNQHIPEINMQSKETMKLRTYLEENHSPIGCRPRMFHPTLKTVVSSLNDRLPTERGL